MKKTIKINNNDNVIIALEELYPGDKVIYQDAKQQNEVTILQNIPFGHKVAIKLPYLIERLKYIEEKTRISELGTNYGLFQLLAV